MLRNLLNKPVTQEYPAILESLNVQVRWRRKPRWLGTAKTKVFRVPPRTQQDPDEYKFMLKASQDYRCEMKAVRAFLIKEVEKANETSTAGILLKTPEELQAEFDEAVKINNAWNAECAKVRAIRMEKTMKEKEEYVMERLAAKEEQKEEQRRKIREQVELQKNLSKHFITNENIDEAIEQALANVVDYNFAIDLDGNMIKGSLSVGKEQKT